MAWPHWLGGEREQRRPAKRHDKPQTGQDGTLCLAAGRMFGVRQRLCGTPQAIADLCSIGHRRRLAASAEPRTRAWQQTCYQTVGGRVVCVCVCVGGVINMFMTLRQATCALNKHL